MTFSGMLVDSGARAPLPIPVLGASAFSFYLLFGVQSVTVA